MRSIRLSLPAVVLGVAVLSLPARAESLLVRYDRQYGAVSVDAKEADARRVVQELFNQCGGAPYMLAPDFAGRITVCIRGTDPTTALRIVLDKVCGGYRMLGRTYYVFNHAKKVHPPLERRAARSCRCDRRPGWLFCPACGKKLN